MLKGIFTIRCLLVIGKRLADVLCQIIDNLNATEERETREETHSASDQAEGALHGEDIVILCYIINIIDGTNIKMYLHGEGEAVLNLVIGGAPNTNHHNLEGVRQKHL